VEDSVVVVVDAEQEAEEEHSCRAGHVAPAQMRWTTFFLAGKNGTQN